MEKFLKDSSPDLTIVLLFVMRAKEEVNNPTKANDIIQCSGRVIVCVPIASVLSCSTSYPPLNSPTKHHLLTSFTTLPLHLFYICFRFDCLVTLGFCLREHPLILLQVTTISS